MTRASASATTERGVVVGIDLKAHSLNVRLDERSVQLPRAFLERAAARGDATLTHGYAITAYVSQGMTCKRAYVLARDDAYREWAYTTMTRATDASLLYVVAERTNRRDEFAPTEPQRDPRAALVAALSRREDRRFASEIIDQPPDRDRGIER
jgi:ATP-dependent exoDNAse (exonuclease V) alpha subunit